MMTKEEFTQAIRQGGNPEGPYDVDPEIRAEVLEELGKS